MGLLSGMVLPGLAQLLKEACAWLRVPLAVVCFQLCQGCCCSAEPLGFLISRKVPEKAGRGAEECFPFAARSPAASLTHSGGIPNMKRGSNTHGRMQVSAEKPGELNGTPLVFDVSELLGQLLQAGAMVHGTAAHAVPWGTAFSFLSLSCGVLS